MQRKHKKVDPISNAIRFCCRTSSSLQRLSCPNPLESQIHSKMATNRQLLIPHKQPLHPPYTTSKTTSPSPRSRTPLPQLLNPSATPAETRMKKAHSQPYDANSAASNGRDADPEPQDQNPEPVKLAFAMPPQPFLDPPTWEAMLKRHARSQAVRAGEQVGGDYAETGSSEETPDQRRRRGEREAEYGSMAIRGRSSVSGRGKRGKGRRGTG